MYAHLPATVYSMGSMVAGVYPLITYKALISEYPRNTIPSISSELRKEQWTSSLFFGADLAYSNIGAYATNQGFEVAEDNTTINCRFPKFGETNTFLDQLDDRCLTDAYFRWSDSLGNRKKFSMLWTIQTHYHYLFRNKEIEYVKNNPDLNRYLNALKADDEAFGMLMEGLKRRKMLEKTLIILTADHGEAFGTHDQVIHASKIYEENVHVPFIMYNPVLFKGGVNDRVGGLIDIAPTISHLVGFKKPEEWQGKSVLSTTNKENNDRAFLICPFNDFLFATRSRNWKYIYNAATNKAELYDLKSDSKELKNVASLYPEIAKREFEMISGWVQYHNKKMMPFLK
jgi:arylsulfatase A-like enzyme